jgi:hypothetical protein
MSNLLKLLLVVCFLSAISVPAMADNVSSCAPDFSSCNVYENSTVIFPFCCAISGDVILTEPDHSVSDVFRIFNDFIDTGDGTGLGLSAFLYSRDDGNLPSPATYSANAVFIAESQVTLPNGLTETVYNGNGTIYNLFSAPVPEASSLVLLGTAIVAVGGSIRKRLTKKIHSTPAA